MFDSVATHQGMIHGKGKTTLSKIWCGQVELSMNQITHFYCTCNVWLSCNSSRNDPWQRKDNFVQEEQEKNKAVWLVVDCLFYQVLKMVCCLFILFFTESGTHLCNWRRNWVSQLPSTSLVAKKGEQQKLIQFTAISIGGCDKLNRKETRHW